MDKPKNTGNSEPSLIKSPEDIKPTVKKRSYKLSTGETVSLTDEEFAVIVEFYDLLRRSRDELNAQGDALEPEKTTQDEENKLNKKVG